jgi:hydroxymethylglutaryl-CoA lyase
VNNLLKAVLEGIDPSKLAVHFHDTYGQALANILVALEGGIRTIDSSVAGLGGCPYAPGASGNVATEDVVYMLHGLDYFTGVDLDKLIDAGDYITAKLGKLTRSRTAAALQAKRSK